MQNKVLFGLLLLIVQHVQSDLTFLERQSTELKEELQALFDADKKSCDSLQLSLQMQRAKQGEAEGHAETSLLIKNLQENLKNRKSALDKMKADLGMGTRPTDTARYAAEESNYHKLAEETQKQINGCKELLAFYETSIAAKDKELHRLKGEESQQVSRNDRLTESIIRQWTEDLTWADEGVRWAIDPSMATSVTRSHQEIATMYKYYGLPIGDLTNSVPPQTGYLFQHDLYKLRAIASLGRAIVRDGKATVMSPHADSGTLTSAGTNKRAEYDATLTELENMSKRTGRLYAEIMTLLSPKLQYAVSESEMKLDYEDVAEKLTKFKAYPRIWDINPETPINDVYPAFKTFTMNCNGTLRKEVLAANVLETVLKQDPKKIASEGEMVSSGFCEWLKKHLGVLKRDVTTKTACDVEKLGPIIPDITLGVNTVHQKYKTEAMVNLSNLQDAVNKGDTAAIFRTKLELKRLKKKFLGEFYDIRVTIRESRQCTSVAAKIEELVHNEPMPQWLKVIASKPYN